MLAFLWIESFFPTIHSVKTGLILTLEECTHYLIKPQTALKLKSSEICDLWNVNTASVRQAHLQTSFPCVAVFEAIRAMQEPTALCHHDTAAKPKTRLGSFHSRLWFHSKKALTQYPLWKKCSICSWICPVTYTACIASQAVAQRRATKLHACNLHIARYLPLTSSHCRWLLI